MTSPSFLAGGGAGLLKGGRHVRFKDVPLANLHLTLWIISASRWRSSATVRGRVDAKILSL